MPVHPESSNGRKKRPVGTLSTDRRSVTTTIDAERCIGCGQCVAVCPKETISLVAEPSGTSGERLIRIRSTGPFLLSVQRAGRIRDLDVPGGEPLEVRA